MVTVNSFSSGLMAKNGVPPVEVTTIPSGWEINSSCLTEPLAVWNWPPATSRTECRRPFGSVRVIRSPGASGPERTPESWSCSGIADAEKSKLPAGPKGTTRHLDSAAYVEMFVGLADRQHGQIDGGLFLERGEQPIRGGTVGRSTKLGLDRLHGELDARQRRVQIRLQPCQGRGGPSLAIHQIQIRVQIAWSELHAQPAGVLQPVTNLHGKVLGIRHGAVKAQCEVDTALPGHLWLGLSAKGKCRGMSFHIIRDDGIGRAITLQGDRDGLPQALVRPHSGVRRPGQLQHPCAAQHALGETVNGQMIGTLLHLLTESGDSGGVETAPDDVDSPSSHGVFDRRRVCDTAVNQSRKPRRITSDVGVVPAELQLAAGV